MIYIEKENEREEINSGSQELRQYPSNNAKIPETHPCKLSEARL